MISEEQLYKKNLIRTFKAFCEFCDLNDLTYFAAYGTALGAVRHNGIIPWDDDIDVCMPRKDYERLFEMELPEGYQIRSLKDKGYWAPFAKWVNSNTTLWEEKSHPVIIGMYIDIFVLDEAGEEAQTTMKIVDSAARNFRRANTNWTWSDIWNKMKGLHPMGFFRLLLDKVWYSNKKDYYTKKLVEAQDLAKNGTGDYLVSYNGPYLNREINKKEWFCSTVKFPFEDFSVNVPVEYDSYLRQLYRDYMQFPPEEKRQSTHSHYYLNLDKGMTMEEVLLEIKEKQK